MHTQGQRTLRRHLYADSPGRAAVPFLVVAVLSLLTLLLPPVHHDGAGLTLTLVGVAMECALVALLTRLPVTHWSVALPPLLFFPLVAVLRDASGGDRSGLSALMLLPVLWIVLFGTRWQLRVAAVLTGLAFFVPLVLIGPPAYSAADWRLGAVWSLTVAVVCPRLQRAVEHLRVEIDERSLAVGRLSSVLRAATGHAIVATDLDGTVTLFSSGAERMLRRRSTDVVGTSVLVLLDDREAAERAAELEVRLGLAVIVHDVPAEGAAERLWTWRRGDGSGVTVCLTVTRLLTGDGHHAGWMCVARDVTSEVATLEELRTREERWRTLLNALPETSVLVVDDDLRYSTAFGGGLTRQGLAGIEGHALAETSGPENAHALEQLYRTALRGAVPSPVELRSTVAGRVIEVAAVPLPGAERAEALVIGRDVTDARAREVELRAARDLFSRLFEETPHGKLLLDATGRVSRANQAAARFLRIGRTALTGREHDSLPVASDEIRGILDEVLAGIHERGDGEVALWQDDPDSICVAVTAVALHGPANEVDGVLVSLVDISERKRQAEHLSYLADHDPVSLLLNRRGFQTALEAHVLWCRRYGPRGALVVLDLDNFKQVNDRLGHAAGDVLIRGVATLLIERCRGTDVLGRLGGDEFAVLLPEADDQAAGAFAADVVRLVEQLPVPGLPQGLVTASIGVVVVRADHDAGGLLGAADLAMYDAKESGRNRFTVH